MNPLLTQLFTQIERIHITEEQKSILRQRLTKCSPQKLALILAVIGNNPKLADLFVKNFTEKLALKRDNVDSVLDSERKFLEAMKLY